MSPVLTQHVSQPITLDEQTQKMKQHLLQDIRRSAYVYRVDCGGCNACEIEIFAAITPVFDAERFGIKVISSPRHADILLFTGAVTRAMRMPALRAYESAPDHKICVSYGACGVGGGIFHDLYSVWGGSDTIVPIDVWIPGCPPTPAATIHGFAVALGLLQQKIHAVDYRDPTGVTMQPLWPQIPPSQRIAIEREARRLAGYRQGREICDRLLRHLSDDPTGNRVNTWLRDADDPRLNSIVQQLFRVLRGYMTEECGEIVFWTLRKKFVASSDEMPEHSSQVMYYSLAIGHHVGVIDCLNVAFRCPLTEYEDWLALVEEEQARRKMLGVMTFGEIVIDASHTALLTRAFAPLADDATSVWQARSIQFIHLLDEIVQEPAIYLMARKIT
ncbi:Hydrogenase-4 maturation protease [Escherichia coli]|nr:Hydrogenase-4 maturation protease [Escherichia coli]